MPTKKFKYQLVLQLPFTSIKDYDAMIQLEETITQILGNFGKVDGHDAGSGQMNIFIHTNDPKVAFDKIESSLGTKDFMPEFKVAFREFSSDDFVILHPKGLDSFTIV